MLFMRKQEGKKKASAKKDVICPFSRIHLPLKHAKLIISPPESEEIKTVSVDFTAFQERASRYGLPVPKRPNNEEFDYYKWAKETIKQPGMTMSVIYFNGILGCQMDYSSE